MTEVACWAHARRKFFEARNECPGQAGWILRHIAHLYRIESELRGKGPQLRQAVRSAQSGMILKGVKK